MRGQKFTRMNVLLNGNSIEPEQNELSKSVEPDKPVTITQEN